MVVSFMFLYRMSFDSLPEIFQDFLHLFLCLKVELIPNRSKNNLQANVISLSSTWNLKYHFTWGNLVASLFLWRARNLETVKHHIELQPS